MSKYSKEFKIKLVNEYLNGNLSYADMVIIDEPIVSIDKKTAIEVIRFVKEFINKDKKRFGIVCTHQAEFIEEFIDNTYTITSISPILSEIK